MTLTSKNTGLTDSLGVEISLGDHVLDPQGFIGEVVFVNGALRYSIHGFSGAFLPYHSSLLVGDGCGTSHLTVIKK